MFPARSVQPGAPALSLPKNWNVPRGVNAISLGVLGPWPALAGVRAHSEWVVLSDTPADFDALGFDIALLNGDGSTTVQTYSFDDDGVTGAYVIELQGLTTEAQIAAAIVAKLRSHGWKVDYVSGADSFRVSQPVPGKLGNTTLALNPSLQGQLTINGFAADGTLKFHGGTEFDVPLRFGRKYGFAQRVADTDPGSDPP